MLHRCTYILVARFLPVGPAARLCYCHYGPLYRLGTHGVQRDGRRRLGDRLQSVIIQVAEQRRLGYGLMSRLISWLTPAAPKLTAARRNGQKRREILAKSAKIGQALGQRERRSCCRLLRRFVSRLAASTLQLHQRYDEGCIVPGHAADVLLECVD